MMNRWVSHHVAEIRKHDSYHAITSEYYQQPFNGVDLRQAIGGHDASNVGFFSSYPNDLITLPEVFAMNDLRYIGKSCGLGEYGVKTHPAWGASSGAPDYHGQRTEEQQRQLFMTVAGYGLGMGACQVQNWCLRDGDDWCFPWGIFYPGPDVPKDVAYTHRNLSMLWRMIEPRYQAPAVSIVSPTPLRNGAQGWLGNTPIYMATQGLLRLHIPFNTVDDFALDRLPVATKTLVWPAAIAESERSFTQVADWVKAGGHLVLTGYPGWDENRAAIKDDLFRTLLGSAASERLFTGIAFNDGPASPTKLPSGTVALHPQARVIPGDDVRILLTADNGTPIVLAHNVGAGMVVWIADPVELRGRDAVPALVDLYRLALTAFPTPPAPIEVTPDDSRLHVMKQRTASGFAWVVYPVADDAPRLVTLATPAGPVQVGVRPWWPAMVQVSDDGRVLMALCDGALKVGDQQLVAGGPMVGLASLDGADLRKSRAVMLYPFEQGTSILKGLPTSGEWGDWREGKWRSLEPVKSTQGHVKIDPDLFTCAALLTSGDPSAWRTRLTHYATDPWTVPGT